jgi:hypothetical protein
MIFRIIGDTIELDGLPVATILPSVWPTRRGYLEQSLDDYEADSDLTIAELRDENLRLTKLVDVLDARIADLENPE